MIRVLIVDDSAIVRKILTEGLSHYNDIKVVGTAMDPYVARDKIVELKPDVVTLDLEMPRMDGLSFLVKLMKYFPIPVVVVSSLTPENSETAIRALELGAVDVVSKPGSTFSTPDVDKVLVRAIRTASRAKVDKNHVIETSLQSRENKPVLTRLQTTHKILAVGASTGGTKAIEVLLRGLPATSPGTVIVQHMPKHFTKSFADRLNSVCEMEVREAKDGDPVVPGVALVAPGDYHMLLQRDGARYGVRLKMGPPVFHQRPSVDVLFHSVSGSAGSNAMGVLLTGMGADGAKGLKEMRDSGAHTIAEDESSCVVFGMPKEAIQMGGAVEVIPLPDIAPRVIQYLSLQTA